MITFFAIPKPFNGHIGIIQRNAIRSWLALRADIQVILCGDENGVAQTAEELGAHHIPGIAVNDFGTPLLSSAFREAESQAIHNLLCYANADLIFFPSFLRTTHAVAGSHRSFLMVGEAWNVDITQELPAERSPWAVDLRKLALDHGTARASLWIDYFVYRRGTLGPLPPFAVGRPFWDNWMIWNARSLRVPVVDASQATQVLHQSHTYGHVKQATGSMWLGPEADKNADLLPFHECSSFSIEDATHQIDSFGTISHARSSLKRRVRAKLLIRPQTAPVYRYLRSLYLWIRRCVQK